MATNENQIIGEENKVNEVLNVFFKNFPKYDPLELMQKYSSKVLELNISDELKEGINFFIDSQYYNFIEADAGKGMECLSNALKTFESSNFNILKNAIILSEFYLEFNEAINYVSTSTATHHFSLDKLDEIMMQINENRDYFIFSHIVNFQYGFIYYLSAIKQYTLTNIDGFKSMLNRSIEITQLESEEYLIKDSPLYNLFYAESNIYKCVGILLENSRDLGIYNFEKYDEDINNETQFFDSIVDYYGKVIGLESQIQIKFTSESISQSILVSKGLKYLSVICKMIGNAMYHLLLNTDEKVILNSTEIKEKLKYANNLFETKVTVNKDIYIGVCNNLETIINNLDQFMKIEEGNAELKIEDKENTKSRIKDAISGNHFEEAIDMLMKHIEDNDQMNTIILIKSGYNKMNDDFMNGLITDVSERQSLLNLRVLKCVDLYLK